MLLAKKEIKDSESVKISRDLHRELKNIVVDVWRVNDANDKQPYRILFRRK